MIREYTRKVYVPGLASEDDPTGLGKGAYVQHNMRETYVDKPAAIKIGQISATGDIENGQTVYGLGHDGKIYCWESEEAQWALDQNPIVEDLGPVSKDPFDKVKS